MRDGHAAAGVAFADVHVGARGSRRAEAAAQGGTVGRVRLGRPVGVEAHRRRAVGATTLPGPGGHPARGASDEYGRPRSAVVGDGLDIVEDPVRGGEPGGDPAPVQEVAARPVQQEHGRSVRSVVAHRDTRPVPCPHRGLLLFNAHREPPSRGDPALDPTSARGCRPVPGTPDHTDSWSPRVRAPVDRALPVPFPVVPDCPGGRRGRGRPQRRRRQPAAAGRRPSRGRVHAPAPTPSPGPWPTSPSQTPPSPPPFPLGVGFAVAVALSLLWRGFLRIVQVTGTVLALATIAAPVALDTDTATRAVLALMHVVLPLVVWLSLAAARRRALS